MSLRTGFFVGALLLLYWAMAVSVSPRVGATSDERVHLVGGYSYWKFDDYRMQPENGNLTMRVEALPLLTMPLHFPSFASEDWRHSRANDVGHMFLFGAENPFATMLWRARAMVALFGVVALWLVWRWARYLFGAAAGWLALTLAVFSPTLLAHGGLATSDMAATAGLLAATTLCWQLLHRVTEWRLLATALAVGAALLAKFSGVLLVPIAALLLLVRWAHPAPLTLAWGGRRRQVRQRAPLITVTLALAVAVAVGATLVVWSAYGFRYSAFNPRLAGVGEPPQLAWSYKLDEPPPATGHETQPPAPATASPPSRPKALVTRAIGWARNHEILPEAFLFGFADSYKGAQNRPAFLNGETSMTGWPQFFPITFLIKTPPTTLLLLLLGAGALVVAAARAHRRHVRWPRHGWFYRSTPLLVLFFLYWAVAINTTLNIGHRHLLPIYPVVYIVAGAAAGWLVLARQRWMAGLLLGGVTVAHAVDSWTARPFYLSYFTPWIGGTARGWHYLVDSSSDWGQGLPDLATWIAAKEAHGDHSPVFLTYFGTDSPEARHLPVTRFGDIFTDLSPRAFPAHVRGGWFVVSATHYQGVYLGYNRPWNADREKLYQKLLHALLDASPDLAKLSKPARSTVAIEARDFEVLQFMRLRRTLRNHEPDALVGASLLLFHLSDAEVQRALYGPPAP